MQSRSWAVCLWWFVLRGLRFVVRENWSQYWIPYASEIESKYYVQKYTRNILLSNELFSIHGFILVGSAQAEYFTSNCCRIFIIGLALLTRSCDLEPIKLGSYLQEAWTGNIPNHLDNRSSSFYSTVRCLMCHAWKIEKDSVKARALNQPILTFEICHRTFSLNHS